MSTIDDPFRDLMRESANSSNDEDGEIDSQKIGSLGLEDLGYGHPGKLLTGY